MPWVLKCLKNVSVKNKLIIQICPHKRPPHTHSCFGSLSGNRDIDTGNTISERWKACGKQDYFNVVILESFLKFNYMYVVYIR